MKKREFWKVLPFLWLVLGVVFSGACYYGQYSLLHSNDNDNQMTHQIESNKTSQKRREELSEKASYDPDQVKPVTPEEYAKAQLRYHEIVNQWGVGALYIPSADIHSKILAGMNNQNLMVGVGTYYADQRLGEGNYVVLAHNLVQGGGALDNLPKTALDQVIYVTDFSKVFEYETRLNEVVDQSRGELIKVPEKDQPALITLIRCEGAINTTKRVVVQGEFTKEYPANEASEDVKIGLGLIEGRWDEEQVPSTENLPSEITENAKGKKTAANKKSSTQRFSPIQTICIRLFTLLKESPYLVGLSYLLGLLVFTHFSAHKQIKF